jgi:hypothetical protein
MPPRLAKGFDLLGLDNSGSDDDEDEQAQEAGPAGGGAAAPAPAKATVDFESLQRAGYRGGPSVLYVPDRSQQTAEPDWAWGQGERGEEQPASVSARAALTHAVGDGLNEALEQQMLAAQHAARLREEAREEAVLRRSEDAAKARKEKLTFNQREKRKRDRGQAVGEQNFVEQEKRIQRQFLRD